MTKQPSEISDRLWPMRTDIFTFKDRANLHRLLSGVRAPYWSRPMLKGERYDYCMVDMDNTLRARMDAIDALGHNPRHSENYFFKTGAKTMAKKRTKQQAERVLTHEELDQKQATWERKYTVEVAAMNAFIELIPRWEQYRWLLTQLTTTLCKVVENPPRRIALWKELDIDKAKRVRDGSPMITFAVSTLWQVPSVPKFQEQLNAVMTRIMAEDEATEAALRAAADKAYGPRVAAPSVPDVEG